MADVAKTLAIDSWILVIFEMKIHLNGLTRAKRLSSV